MSKQRGYVTHWNKAFDEGAEWAKEEAQKAEAKRWANHVPAYYLVIALLIGLAVMPLLKVIFKG